MSDQPPVHDTPLPNPPLPEGPPPSPPGPQNAWFTELADLQGIPFGDWDTWYKGGYPPPAHATGSSQADGWTHKHKMNAEFIKQVVANMACRRIFYDGKPHRQFAYVVAGRPDGWTPEMSGDNPDGSFSRKAANSPKILTVTGPNPEHFWVTNLFELMDDPSPIMLTLPNTDRAPSDEVAEAIVIYYLRNLIGQIRDPGSPTEPVYSVFGDRSNSRILDTVVEAWKRKAVEQDDLVTFDLWLRNAMLPHYETGAGITPFSKGSSPTFNLGLFNSWSWVLGTCHNAAQVLPAGDVVDRLEAIVARLSQWGVDMVEKFGTGIRHAAHIAGSWSIAAGPPPASIATWLETATPSYASWSYELYSFYGWSVAAKISGNAKVQQLVDETVQNNQNADANAKVWLVDADRNPV